MEKYGSIAKECENSERERESEKLTQSRYSSEWNQTTSIYALTHQTSVQPEITAPQLPDSLGSCQSRQVSLEAKRRSTTH